MFTRRARLIVCPLALALILGATAVASASIHVTYNVLPKFTTDGFTASWLHSATSGPPHGSEENGALLEGAMSSRIAGTLEGDLLGNVLSNASGSVSGKLKQLSSYLNVAFGTSFTTYTPFELKLGGQAVGSDGALAFETNGAGTGQFTGGFLDFSLFVDGNTTSLIDGTFFFKPQAESGNAALSPNRGTNSTFTLWGWNWMHDGPPVVGTGPEPIWATFLSGLGYTGPAVLRTPSDGGPQLLNPLGIAMYVADPDPPALEGLHNPEPAALVTWSLLIAIVFMAYRRNNTNAEARRTCRPA